MRDLIVKLTASGLGTGYAPVAPGSWGTIPGLVLAWILFRYGWQVQLPVTLVFLVLAVWSASAAERIYGHDAKKIVIDEIAGMLVALVFVPFLWQYYLLGFVIFRILDVWKPWPAANWENLPRGWGVMADDFAVAIYTNVILQLVALFRFWM